MNFNGLIRKFTQMPTLANDPSFLFLQRELPLKMESFKLDFSVNNTDMGKSHWATIRTHYPRGEDRKADVYLDPEIHNAISDLVDKIKKNFIVPHNLAIVNLVWMNPGEAANKHIDIRKIYRFTRRFNIFLNVAGLEYVSYRGIDQAEKIPVKNGDIFELNNRAPHEAKNNSSDTALLLVLDFIDASEKRPRRFFEGYDIEELCVPPETPTVVWDYS